jgi:hypothetical protein
MAAELIPSPATIERMLDEVEEYSHAVEGLRRKQKRHKPGSAPYHDLLPDLWVQVDVLRLKAKHAAEALKEYEESLPEEQ